ncbi:MAG TPA: hypothetical protein VIL74_23895 [Pyrinomonadaceae bacterium]
MSRKMLRICSMLGLVTVLSVAAARAQTATGRQAQTLFNTENVQKIHRTGDAAPEKPQDASEIQNRQNEKSRIVSTHSGDVAREMSLSKSAFESLNDRYALAAIATPDAGAKLRKSKLKERPAKEKKTLSETVEIHKQNR